MRATPTPPKAPCSRMTRLVNAYAHAVILALALSLLGVCMGENVTESPEEGGETQYPDVPVGAPPTGTPFEPSPLLTSEIDRCGEVIDMHFHEAFWFKTAGPLLAEMDAAGISRGILMSPYGAKASPFSDDPNTSVRRIAVESGGRIFGMASLNTTGNWSETEDEELDRLETFLSYSPEMAGGKVANPHTCLELGSIIMQEVVRVVSESPSPTLIVHVGTTPFCGPFGIITAGMVGCCGPEYVDPYYFEPLIVAYPNVTFVLMHVAHDFLEPGNEHYYNNTLVDHTLDVALRHSNVYIELSAFLKQPLANVTMSKIVAAGMAGRSIYGSDTNHAPASLGPYLEMAVAAMIDAGFTKDERCSTLSGNAVEAFRLGPYVPGSPAPTAGPTAGGNGTETDGPTAAPTVSPTAGGNATETESPTAAPTVSPTTGGNVTETDSPSSSPTEAQSSASRFLGAQGGAMLAGIACHLLLF